MRDAPGFGHTPGFGSPGGHAFPEHRGDPTPAGTGRGFAIGRGRAPQGTHTAHVPPYVLLLVLKVQSCSLTVTSSSQHIYWIV